MDPNSDFQKKIVEYLEALCVGEFLTGTKSEISEKTKLASVAPEYKTLFALCQSLLHLLVQIMFRMFKL